MYKINLRNVILNDISESLLFTENNVYSICIDYDVNIAVVTNELNKLIKENRVQKMYYCPSEERKAIEPIGLNSYPIYVLKVPKLNIAELMK